MSPVLQALNPWFDEYAVKPLSYVNLVAVSDAAAVGQAAAVLPPAAAAEPAGEITSSLPCVQSPARDGESDPAVMLDYAPAGPSHADQLQQLADLIAANNASCEDDVPLFLRQARRA